MLSTVHEAIFVETGHVDRDWKKIEKPECIYYYCARMGGVDLSDQLLNYYSYFYYSSFNQVSNPRRIKIVQNSTPSSAK